MIIGITDYYRSPFDIEAEALGGGGVEFIDFNSRDENDFDEDSLSKLDALLVYHARITDKTLARLDRCKIIVRYGVGVDNMDLGALKRRGIPLCHTPDYGVEEIAATAASPSALSRLAPPDIPWVAATQQTWIPELASHSRDAVSSNAKGRMSTCSKPASAIRVTTSVSGPLSAHKQHDSFKLPPLSPCQI